MEWIGVIIIIWVLCFLLILFFTSKLFNTKEYIEFEKTWNDLVFQLKKERGKVLKTLKVKK